MTVQSTKISLMLGLSGMLLCGCASWPFEGNAQVTPAGTAPQLAQADAQDGATADSDGYGYPDYSNIEPAAGPAPARAARQRAAAPTAGVATAYPALVDPVMAQRTAALQNEVAKLEDRLQRVEKAALRLDRRMQLVERNELSKMNTAANDDDSAPRAADAGDNNGSDAFNNDSGAPTTIKVSGPRAGYGDGFQPVSTPITSALQAAPRGETASARAPQSTAQVASNQLPSLADPATTSSRVPDGDDKLAIWTVHYNNDKVWPERDQLPSSRDVVSLLREGGKATLFARGAQPNSREFRERVKALSRYLAKVSSLDSVPIAALSAPHLDGDTIEVFAQP